MSELKYKKPKIVIPNRSEPSSYSSGVMGMLAMFSILIAAAAGYLFSQNQFEKQAAPEKTDRAVLTSQIQSLSTQNTELNAKLAIAERSSAIDGTASEATQQNLADKEQEVKTLKEELSFYKSIVSPEGADTGLNINSFSLNDGLAEREFNYQLVLTQVGGGSLEARGTVLLRAQGLQDGVDKVLEWWDIRPESTMPMPSFGFKYFQRMDGKIILPEGFVPSNILVKIIPDSTRLKSSQQSYTWDAALVGGI